jgi:Zn-finger nucleic acid-binding protein
MILIACPACDRQYDVTDVPVGQRVRCACDALLHVGTQGSLAVRALHCSHCAGAVLAEEANCRWCGAKLSATDRRESTLCPKCGARIEDHARHCRACGVAIAPQALTPLPADKVCPRCAGELELRSLGKTDVIECAVCGGLWLTAHVFEAVCRDAERRLDTFLPEPSGAAAPVTPPAEPRYIPCLGCGELMHRRAFRHGKRASGVVVDYCRGHGVWLDRDELEHIVRFVRRVGPGSAPGEGLAPYLEPSLEQERARPRSRTSPLGRPFGGGVFSGPFADGATLLDALVVLGELMVRFLR